MAGYSIDFLSNPGQGYVKKKRTGWCVFYCRQTYKPGSVLPQISFHHFAVVDMINLHIALLHMSSLLPAPDAGRICGGLFEVAARRDCPFHSN